MALSWRACRAGLLPVALTLLGTAPLTGQVQATTGVIRGIVADSAGRPLEAATVTLRQLETNAMLSLATT